MAGSSSEITNPSTSTNGSSFKRFRGSASACWRAPGCIFRHGGRWYDVTMSVALAPSSLGRGRGEGCFRGYAVTPTRTLPRQGGGEPRSLCQWEDSYENRQRGNDDLRRRLAAMDL